MHTNTHWHSLTGFSRVLPGYSSTKEESQKRHWQLFAELLSPHKTAPAAGDPCWEHKVCCSHSHTGTIVISCLGTKAVLLLQDLHKNIIPFNSRIILELMPGIRGKNVFLAGLQVFLFFLFLPVGWSRGQGSTPASASTADALWPAQGGWPEVTYCYFEKVL